MTPRPVYQHRSYRIVPGGGRDRSGKYRGYDIEKLSTGRWKFHRFRTDLEEAKQMILDHYFLGVKL